MIQPTPKQLVHLLTNYGFGVFPCSKVVDGDKRSKQPKTKQWQQTKPGDYHSADLLAKLDEGWCLGATIPPNAVVFDVDKRNGGLESWRQIDEEFGPFDSLRVDSPSGGFHVYCSKPADSRLFGKIKDRPGVDVLTTGRFVMVPGSPHYLGGRYTVGNWTTIGPAPDAILREITRPESESPPRQVDSVEVADGLREVRDLLSICRPEGSPWSDILFAVHHATAGDPRGLELFQAWSVQEFGYDGTEEAIRKRWESLDPHRCNGITVSTLHRWVQQSARIQYDEWRRDEARREFSRLDGDSDSASRTTEDKDIVFQPMTLEELKQLPEPNWLIRDVISEGEIGILWGESNVGKSFVTMDLIFALASGKPWAKRFHVPEARRVIYCTGEGKAGVGRRAEAAERRHGTPIAPISFLMKVPQLFEVGSKEGVYQFIDDIDRLGIKPALIILDTFSHAHVGGEENSASDMAVAFHSAQLITEWLSSAVLIVHHEAKSGGQFRGSSVIKASADVMIRAYRDGGVSYISPTKVRDGSPWGRLPFSIVDERLPEDRTTGVVDWTEFDKGGRPATARDEVINYLRDHGDSTARDIADSLGKHPSNLTRILRSLGESGQVDSAIRDGSRVYHLVTADNLF